VTSWNLALDPGDIDDLASTVELTFVANMAGTEVRLVQSNVPAYRVDPGHGRGPTTQRDRQHTLAAAVLGTDARLLPTDERNLKTSTFTHRTEPVTSALPPSSRR
jgi:hypothetical protein